MNRTALVCLSASALGGAATPALAHLTSSAALHWHSSDTWGLFVVAALVAAAAWLDRRRR